ncbi:hypothetical protein IID10_19105, partial [candidate division KSB1 bacterium]|nr:hypothetical protein [candidate division KSB1 bacterium]
MIAPDWYPSREKLRQFAVIALFGFGLMGLVARFKFGLEVTPYIVWTIGGLTFLLGLISPTSVLPVYVALMGITIPIGWFVSHL